MANPYTPVVVSGYNANPPADDGSAVASNQVLWATIKTKLPDPLKTAIEAVNANNVTAFGKLMGGVSPLSTGVSYAVLAADQGKPIRATASGITITFPDATSVGAPFVFSVLNSSSGNITLAGASAQTINGSTSITMAAGDGYTAFTDGSNWFVLGRKTGVLGRGYIDGCTIANATGDATNDITIAAGVCRDSTNTVDITVAAMATGKQLDANWAPGDAAGMRNSAAGIADTTYHLYAVAKADGTQDIYAHTSTTVATVITALQAESGGASYVYARRIGSIVRSSAAILAFTQVGDSFRWKAPPRDINTSSLTTSSTTNTLTIPVGLVLEARLNCFASHASSQSNVYIRALTETDDPPSASNAPVATLRATASGAGTTVQANVFTNTSAQVAARADNSSTTLVVATVGWRDARGKDA